VREEQVEQLFHRGSLGDPRARATDSTSSEALRRSAKRYLRLDQYVDAELLPETSR
jgi:hypothetical protein